MKLSDLKISVHSAHSEAATYITLEQLFRLLGVVPAVSCLVHAEIAIQWNKEGTALVPTEAALAYQRTKEL